MKFLPILILILVLCGCSVNQSPGYGVNDPTWIYFDCQRCASLDGGCYLTGATKSYRTEAGYNCYHSWSKITRDKFVKDWERETGTKLKFPLTPPPGL